MKDDPLIETYLKGLAAGDNRLLALLDYSVGRVLRKESARYGTLRSPTEEVATHIVDWLQSSIIRNEPWLSNVDGFGRPKKLMKFASIDLIKREADRAMLRWNSQTPSFDLREGDEEVIFEASSGSKFVRLLTPEALDYESQAMGHCIGNGAYDFRLRTGRHWFVSVRDKTGKPHVTLELTDWEAAMTLLQVQGKQNRVPVDKYLPDLIEFADAFHVGKTVLARKFNYVIDESGEWHHLSALPDGLVVNALYVDSYPIERLPENLVVKDDLMITSPLLKRMPEVYEVHGSIQLLFSGITEFQKPANVPYSIDLSYTPVRYLSDGIKTKKALNLEGSDILELPRGLEVGTVLNISATGICSLPNDISVGEEIIMRRTVVQTIPESVGDDVTISHGRFQRLSAYGKTGGFSGAACLASDLREQNGAWNWFVRWFYRRKRKIEKNDIEQMRKDRLLHTIN